ncbi:MAG: sigma-54-dependent Fis family transcriptional regulator, partial [Planctomycetes bacterium]|nr:sigma-54-dependent Fis family transcriptional regulator [Planctomycetota bacterium]
RAIHFNGPRGRGPFISENCAAIPEGLLESTLFGYRKGAFTGAGEDRPGLFQLAHGGTLFLDEVSEMPEACQKGLLRVLQEGEVRPLGAEEVLRVDVRVLSATNRDLPRQVESGRFREDLYYRLAGVTVHLPPLRERREDIPILLRHFLETHARRTGGRVPEAAPEVLEALGRYAWPGNVRELENEVARMTLFRGERITLAHLSPRVAATLPPPATTGQTHTQAPPPGAVDAQGDLHEQVEAFERRVIATALASCEGNKSEAARRLGLSRRGLYKKLATLGGVSP